MLGNQGPPAMGSRATLGWAAVIAALLWALGLLAGDLFHVLMIGDVDTVAFLVLILALAPAWAFIGRNVSISFLGQNVSVNLTQQDVESASGDAAMPPKSKPADEATPPKPKPADDAAAVRDLLKSIDDITGVAVDLNAHQDLLKSLRNLRTQSAVLRDPDGAKRRQVVVVDPLPTGDPAIDLRNRIAVRLNALAQKYEIVPPGNSAASLLAALQARDVLSAAEAGALAKLMDLGNEVAHGRAPGPRNLALIQNAQVGVIANLDRKLADG